MNRITASILCGIMLFSLLAGCSEQTANVTELQYPDMFYLEREECRFDLDEISGFKTPEMEKVVNKGKKIRTSTEGKLLAEEILTKLHSSELLQGYIPAYVEYATKDKVWLFAYETTERLVMGSTMYYIVVNSSKGELIAHWHSGTFQQQNTTENMAIQYPETRYYKVEQCSFDLNAMKHQKHPGLEEALSECKPIQSSWEGKLMSENLLLNELQTWSKEHQNYVPFYVEHATEEQIWIFAYGSKTWMTDNLPQIYIAVDAANGSLITYWYE